MHANICKTRSFHNWIRFVVLFTLFIGGLYGLFYTNNLSHLNEKNLQPQSATIQTLQNGLVAQWTFDGNLLDQVGGLSISGSASYAEGRIGSQCLQLKTTALGQTASTNILDTDTHSIAFWVKFGNHSFSSWGPFLFGYQPAGTDRSPKIWWNPAGRLLHWKYDVGSTGINGGGPQGDAGLNGLSGSHFTENEWVHIVGIKEGNLFSYYVNGELKAQMNVVATKVNGSSPIYFGYGDWQLDDLRIYNRTLTQEEISTLNVAADLAAWWTFDEGSLIDYSLYNHSITKQTPLFDVGKIGHSIKFSVNTTEDELSVLNHPSLQISDAWSFGGWILPSSSMINQTGVVLWKNYEYGIRFVTDHFEAVLFDGSYKILSTPILNLNEWIHLMVVRNGNECHLFFNGLEIAQIQIGTITPTIANLYLGSQSGMNGFDGLLDDLRIYRKALYSSEIQVLAQNGGYLPQIIPQDPTLLTAGNFPGVTETLYNGSHSNIQNSSWTGIVNTLNETGDYITYKSTDTYQNSLKYRFLGQISSSTIMDANGEAAFLVPLNSYRYFDSLNPSITISFNASWRVETSDFGGVAYVAAGTYDQLTNGERTQYYQNFATILRSVATTSTNYSINGGNQITLTLSLNHAKTALAASNYAINTIWIKIGMHTYQTLGITNTEVPTIYNWTDRAYNLRWGTGTTDSGYPGLRTNAKGLLYVSNLHVQGNVTASPNPNILPSLNTSIQIPFLMNQTLAWKIKDTVSNVDLQEYSLEQNGTHLLSGFWIHNGEIVYDIKENAQLRAGFYTYSLQVNDGYGGQTYHIYQVEITATSPTLQPNIIATPANGNITLSWDPITTPIETDGGSLIAKYIIDRQKDNDSWVENYAIFTGNDISMWNDSAVVNTSQYIYRIRVENGAGLQSNPSDATLPCTPQSIIGQTNETTDTTTSSSTTSSTSTSSSTGSGSSTNTDGSSASSSSSDSTSHIISMKIDMTIIVCSIVAGAIIMMVIRYKFNPPSMATAQYMTKNDGNVLEKPPRRQFFQRKAKTHSPSYQTQTDTKSEFPINSRPPSSRVYTIGKKGGSIE